jgi:hypothetical protein
MDFKKLHKTRQKSLNFFHEHTVLLVLLLIIVMHYFLYESKTQIHTKQKLSMDRKNSDVFSNYRFTPNAVSPIRIRLQKVTKYFGLETF